MSMGNFPESLLSTNLSRDHLGREIGGRSNSSTITIYSKLIASFIIVIIPIILPLTTINSYYY